MPVTYGEFVDDGGAVYNVKHTAFGAVGNGTTDDTAAIQAAINQVKASGGTVFFPAGRYRITSTLNIGTSTDAATYGVVLQGVRHTPFPGSAQIFWDGADGGTLLSVFDSFGGKIDSLDFSGITRATRGAGSNQSEHAGLLFHIRYGTASPSLATEHWSISNCSFCGASRYNVLIGDDAGVTAQNGDASLISFYNCYFRRIPQGETSANTVAHIRHRTSNGFSNSCYGCQFDGDGTYPTYAVSMMSGTMNFYSTVSVGTGTADFFLEGESGALAPGVGVWGWESQSRHFMRANTTSADSAQHAVVLSGLSHSDISSDPQNSAESIIWNEGGWGQLVLVGCHFNRDVKVDHADAKVFALGVLFDDRTDSTHPNGYGFTGYTDRVSGLWFDAPDFRVQALNRTALGKNEIYAPPLSVANNAVTYLTPGLSGTVFVTDDAGGTGVFAFRGGLHAVALVADPWGQYSATQNTAGKVNVYWDAGAGYYAIQNKRGVNLVLRVHVVGPEV